jgi:Leucine-rich repeat (LRR) protein
MLTEYEPSVGYFHIDEAYQSDMDKVVYPETYEDLYLLGDYVQHFAPPPGPISLNCTRVGLRTLIVPNGVESLVCEDNYISELILPPSIQTVNAIQNLICTLRPADPDVGLPNLLDLHISFNKMTKFEFPTPPKLRSLEIDGMTVELSPDWKAVYDFTNEPFYM